MCVVHAVCSLISNRLPASYLMCCLCNVLHGSHASQDIGDIHQPHQLGLRTEHLVESLHCNCNSALAVVKKPVGDADFPRSVVTPHLHVELLRVLRQRYVPELGARPLSDQLPGHKVAVMFRNRQQHLEMMATFRSHSCSSLTGSAATLCLTTLTSSPGRKLLRPQLYATRLSASLAFFVNTTSL